MKEVFVPFSNDLSLWKLRTRSLLSNSIPPDKIIWAKQNKALPLFAHIEVDKLPQARSKIRMPKDFASIVGKVAYHRKDEKWQLLYSAAWRIRCGERNLLQIATDPLVQKLRLLASNVSRDAHKAKAFIRFKKFAGETTAIENRTESFEFIAHHPSEHYIARLISQFMVERFNSFTWKLTTELESLSWNGIELKYGNGQTKVETLEDPIEDLWKSYYSSIFNASRVNRQAMLSEMPKKYWKYLPEATLIPQLIENARTSSETMQQRGFEKALPPTFSIAKGSNNIVELQNNLKTCKACELCDSANKTVFQPVSSSEKFTLMIIGEQAGDKEDLSGRPFTGPAGSLLRSVLVEQAIDIDSIYFTNVVKHFHFEQRGKKRLHAKPKRIHISACRPWLFREIELLCPEIILCLGSTASQTIFGPEFKISKKRGSFISSGFANYTIASYHPSALLRATGTSRGDQMRDDFKDDVRQVSELIRFLAQKPGRLPAIT